MSEVEIYLKLVLDGERTINDVPARVRPELTDRLLALGRSDLVKSDGKGVK